MPLTKSCGCGDLIPTDVDQCPMCYVNEARRAVRAWEAVKQHPILIDPGGIPPTTWHVWAVGHEGEVVAQVDSGDPITAVLEVARLIVASSKSDIQTGP